ncbi:MAG: MogA/MoaB family molybdenum cofactor biosynthesis protein [Spirochaetaceae bacterium]|jgi:molybdenum cofactor synthesis domain-containing protein|nr:MogA/MoaB family molybdenum cofactor biosynthesis protein [Spirochaetaceae bacterium]
MNSLPKPETDGGLRLYRAAVITLSDKAAAGLRVDESGPVVREIAEKSGFSVVSAVVLPDEQSLLEAELKRICDTGIAELALTTGGTGFSPRDITPEATAAVAERLAYGIAEAMRAAGLAHTKRAMLSRGIAALRKKTLIINLPGSPKAARESLEAVITEVRHGIDILTGADSECAR